MASELGDMDVIKELLFKCAMRGQWEKLVGIYEISSLQEAKITRSGDTALHIAVSDGKIDIVRRLVNLIPPENKSTVLKMKNERGNTPLHVAASMGIVEMCECLVMPDSELVRARNHDGETPFFLAALHGNKKAFLYLQDLCFGNGDHDVYYSFCLRNDDETILHSAISGNYFDLAFQIIHLYPDLINYTNRNGLTPLHILASKPSAFKSGCPLGWLDSFIYHCIFVDEVKEESDNHHGMPGTFVDEVKEESDNHHAYPEKNPDENRSKYSEKFFQYMMGIFKTLGTFVDKLKKESHNRLEKSRDENGA